MTSDRVRLTTEMADRTAKGAFLLRVELSNDETLGKGKFWRSASYLRNVGFDDLMNILMHYLSLQPDLRLFAAKIKARDFFWETVQSHWQKRARQLFPFVEGYIWTSGPGPAGGTAGSAESYSLDLGLYNKSLLDFFLWPKELKEESEKNWPRHKERIERMLFPKLRRRYNQKKLEAALTFAKEICEIMRQQAAIPKNGKP